jgi:hypothetical protein
MVMVARSLHNDRDGVSRPPSFIKQEANVISYNGDGRKIRAYDSDGVIAPNLIKQEAQFMQQ